MKTLKIFTAAIVIVFLSNNLFARKTESKKNGNNGSGKKAENTPPSVMAGCSPATARTDLDINNVKAMIHSGGDMWWDLQNNPKYEVPKNSGKKSLFAGALWLGGKDVSGQLKVAAQTFRNEGNDFWTGPLSTANSEISLETCLAWDKHFVTFRDTVSRFKSWFQAGVDDAANGTTTQQDNFPNFQIDKSILDWPAHGRNNEPYNEDFYLAPFFDNNNDGVYNPLDGDYPAYDFSSKPSCTVGKIDKIYGDQNLWWVFNDKGNSHTQTGSASIGMEIRAQAFAFATSDEVNNMTFYNYELYNRSTYTLTETFFGQWVDADLGNPNDDYVGCDVQRGLGYCFNGDEMDESSGGSIGYGSQPPAIGVDFFQGPYQDNDGFDNPGPLTNDAVLTYGIADNGQTQKNGGIWDKDLEVSIRGIPYKGLGIGYGDSISDNERFGMTKFLYYNNGNCNTNCDPDNGPQYYNYLRGYWKDGTRMVYGGNGHKASGGTEHANYMFPDNTDPVGWGTGGKDLGIWTEVTAGNTPADRRFMQSAGPFTLGPGAINNITVGVVWAQATAGGRLASVESMRKADDKTQAMFDNCFQVVDGPDAPEISFREMDRELIMYISNKKIVSNNENEGYSGTDIFLAAPSAIDKNGDGTMDYTLTPQERDEFNKYKFQGYLVYQVKDNSVSTGDIKDPTKARLVFQCDIKDGVGKIVNNYLSSETGSDVPVLEVDGADKGIVHSLSITEDKFAVGDKRLVNHKKLYYLVLAYAYNNSSFNQYLPENTRQKKPFIASRKAAAGGIKVYTAIPHKTDMDKGGLVTNSSFGDEMSITRVEGTGNGGRAIYMLKENLEEAVSNGRVKNITYLKGAAPVSIKVIDPLNVPKKNFTIRFLDSLSVAFMTDKDTRIDSAGYWWYLWEDGKYVQGKMSDKAILVENEQLLPDWGISVTVKQATLPRTFDQAPLEYENDLLESKLVFDDPDKAWLTGVPDLEGFVAQNWIRCGTSVAPAPDENFDDRYYLISGNKIFTDEKQVYEKVLGGTWAPFVFGSRQPHGPLPNSALFDNGSNINPNTGAFQLKYLQSADIVFTADKSKWTRCPVLEMQEEAVLSQGIIYNKTAYYPGQNPIPTLSPSKYVKGFIRSAPSVDKNGTPYDTAGFEALNWKVDSLKKYGLNAQDTTNPNASNYISPVGMGWFPGYAVNVETGERLNIAFGEDSWLGAENGRDMKWNPTGQITQGPWEDVRFGGKHYIFIFRNNAVEDVGHAAQTQPQAPYPTDKFPAYDGGKFMFTNLAKTQSGASSGLDFKRVYRAAMWVGLPLLNTGYDFKDPSDIPTDATVSLRVSRPFENYGTGEWLSKGDKLKPGDYYLVDKGPIIHSNITYYRGQSFYAKNDTFNIDALNITNGDTINNLVTTTNAGRPKYTFSTKEYAADTNQSEVMNDALKLINVVPNPYYAYSEYETDKLDNRIKIINLPRKCNVSIYTTNGTLVRKFTKDDPTISSIDWDLKNTARVPVASGIYIIHVEVPDVGERTLKWMGIMRPVDLDSF